MALTPPVTSRDHVVGRADAPVTLVEYGDYQCPHCRGAHPIVRRITARYGDALRFAFRHFPLTEVHPMAGPAAETAEFAAVQQRFWPMHDALFEHQPELSPPTLAMLAQALGLSPVALGDALRSGAFSERVREHFLSGVYSGVNGTPSFFINGRRHDGDWSYASLTTAIDARMPAPAH